jgi:uncharacterized protein (TIGR03086 family)
MDGLDSLDRARSEFERRLRAVEVEQWSLDTPCAGWTVRDVVNHVVGGNRMAVALLAGASRDEARAARGVDALGDDPIAAFEPSADELAASFAAPGARDRICHHGVGDIPGEQLLGFRTADYALHAWDLARAIGGDEQLDDALVEELWQVMSPMAPMIGGSGQFGTGPSGDLDADAPLQARLLDLSGRRPAP